MDLKKKKVIVICFLVVLCVALSLWQSSPQVIKEEPITWQKKIDRPKAQPVKICVYVSGAVRNPGLHQIPLGSRGQDAIALAGGFLPEANKDKVNLARKLKDGHHINVPFAKEKTGGKKRYAQGEASLEPEKPQKIEKVNINQADSHELASLSGIGEYLAESIISYRQKQPFKKIEDLQKVPGIGPRKFSRIKTEVEV